MVVQMRPRAITVDRGSRGFGLSLIYRGLDKFDEKDTGIFVARVVPQGQAARFGVRENDKILTINGKTPRNVDDAVNVIKQAGNQIKLVVLREEDVPAVHVADGDERASMGSGQWFNESGQLPLSRSGSARSFNTTFGKPTTPTPPSPGPGRRPPGSPQPHARQNTNPNLSFQQQQQQAEMARQQQEMQRQQQQQQEYQRQQQLQHQQQMQQQQLVEQQRQQIAEQQRILAEQQRQAQEYEQARRQRDNQDIQANQVRDMLARTDFGFEMRPKSPGSKSLGSGMSREMKKTTESTIVSETVGGRPYNKYKSTNSLHELGLDNYPNPELPEGMRLSRKEEKQSLQNLNNRLAGYIDRVRQLQNENAKLTHQIRTVEEYQSKEINNVRDAYEKQIIELKEALENLNKQYNQLKVGAEGLLNENTESKEKLKRKENDLKNANDHVNALEDELRNMGSKLSQAESEKRKLQEHLQDVLPEIESLREQLAKAKRMLDDEQLKKAELENKCERLEEDLKFKLQMLEQELTEVKRRKEIEIHEMDGKLQEEYESRLEKALDELRDVYEKQMKQSREDFSTLYEERIRDLSSQLSGERGSNAMTKQELKESKSRIEALIRKVTDLESANLALNQKIADLAQEMEDLRSAHRAQLNAKDDEIQRLLDQLSQQMKDYQQLHDEKIALDMEIQVYRRLIESEEDRLGIAASLSGKGSLGIAASLSGKSKVQQVLVPHQETIFGRNRSIDSSDNNSDHGRVRSKSIERKTEQTFQRKITVSQTQL